MLVPSHRRVRYDTGMVMNLTARMDSFVDDPDQDVLLAGVGEHPDGGGWSLTVQGGSPDPDEDTGDEEYCLVTQTGACVYGQLDAVVLDRDQLRLTLSRRAAADLGLARRIRVVLDSGADSIDRFRDGLARIFASTSIDSRPRTLELPGSTPSVRPRPRRHRRTARGTRVEYVITGRRAALVDVQSQADPIHHRVEIAAVLARVLGVDDNTVVGRRYSCLVVTDRIGRTESDFQLHRPADK